MTNIIIIISVITIGVIGLSFVVHTGVSTRKKYYKEYMNRKKNKEC